MKVAPSLLSADFMHLAKEIESVSNADFLHVDVMDGHYVPNLTMGPVVLENVTKMSKVPLDVHLMVENASFFVGLFAPLNPQIISIHAENEKHPHRVLQLIKNSGITPGVVLNPHTHEESLKYLLESVGLVLLMSVNPGFGGQKFLNLVLEKCLKVKELIERYNPSCLLEVDGGVNDKNIFELQQAGVDVVVSGSYIFKSKDRKLAIEGLQNVRQPLA
ncbi:ribulose-phosphate 3-epimerase [Helicobacter pylori]|uniref:ribulose-phosphate 3-epimerase n=1 Tax=Helicobacter pylori TaxID=210 RepID=UPI000762C202|nr:ribulose-phosphate 3-epimerase [Helicobacter pylori]MUU68205.1 ribulose-phosphate 3-epimerase [Helicobacter pylori]OJZ96038.1 ribulose-phosphate 3-epimerase [Helicobacter pylori]OJZ99812.1 ribulose-phosphate 3-epimerase [Helicobacter pylori]WQZ51569.1 ribulose-phosphate 3-epimerase [Helicobacter pylori]GHP98551.1 ribulose-phosphate 3-epimerase [Helicobacter pylori]